LLLAAFAVAALLLAMLGIAGLLAYNTAQRTQEFGVRIALGADRRDLLLLVFKQSLRLSGDRYWDRVSRIHSCDSRNFGAALRYEPV
jgi:hypothetical protein